MAGRRARLDRLRLAHVEDAARPAAAEAAHPAAHPAAEQVEEADEQQRGQEAPGLRRHRRLRHVLHRDEVTRADAQLRLGRLDLLLELLDGADREVVGGARRLGARRVPAPAAARLQAAAAALPRRGAGLHHPVQRLVRNVHLDHGAVDDEELAHTARGEHVGEEVLHRDLLRWPAAAGLAGGQGVGDN